jgi:hypothetical protein
MTTTPSQGAESGLQQKKPATPSVSALDGLTKPRHRWYFVKEAFSPAFVDHAIDDADCKPGEVVVDPFSGSGTTALVAAERGLTGYSLEVNPFLAFVGRAKTARCRSTVLKGSVRAVVRSIEKGADSPLVGFSTFTKGESREKWLFNDEVLRAFAGGWATASEAAPQPRRLLQLGLLGAAMDSCNAVKDGKCLRYRRDWETLRLDAESLAESFRSRVATMVEDLDDKPLSKTVTIRDGDARNTSISPDTKFSLCVTSPPYLNSFDYTDVYRPELFLGSFIESMAELRKLRLRSVRSHVQVNWKAPEDVDFGPSFSEVVAAISGRADRLWNKRLPMMITAYFEDMKKVLKRLRTRARKNAALWLVVSTSAYAGVEIPVDLILADIGVRQGWYLREVRTLRHLRRVPVQQWHELEKEAQRKQVLQERTYAGPHLRESVVILDASPR